VLSPPGDSALQCRNPPARGLSELAAVTEDARMNKLTTVSSIALMLACSAALAQGDTDAVNTARVEGKLKQTPALDNSNIDVRTVDGNMELTGLVEDRQEASTAMMSAHDVMMTDHNNLHHITNNMTIRNPDFGNFGNGYTPYSSTPKGTSNDTTPHDALPEDVH
jgi:hypothetical protein